MAGRAEESTVAAAVAAACWVLQTVWELVGAAGLAWAFSPKVSVPRWHPGIALLGGKRTDALDAMMLEGQRGAFVPNLDVVFDLGRRQQCPKSLQHLHAATGTILSKDALPLQSWVGRAMSFVPRHPESILS